MLSFFLINSCSNDDTELDEVKLVNDLSITIQERPNSNEILGSFNNISGLTDLSFSLAASNAPNAISIDSSTGEISVSDSDLFDIVNNPNITADVIVSNGDVSQTANLNIALRLDEAPISYFKSIALGFEFGNASEITRKWVNNMKVFVGGSPNETLLNELNQIIDDLNELTQPSFSIEVVSDTLASNYYLFLGTGSQFAEIFPANASLISSNWGLFSIFWNGSNELFRGYMYVDTQRANELEQRHLLREELTQSLGLAKDSFLYPESIFQQAFSTKTTEFAEIDKKIIKLLYHPSMTIGLNQVQVDPKLREILKSEW